MLFQMLSDQPKLPANNILQALLNAQVIVSAVKCLDKRHSSTVIGEGSGLSKACDRLFNQKLIADFLPRRPLDSHNFHLLRPDIIYVLWHMEFREVWFEEGLE